MSRQLTLQEAINANLVWRVVRINQPEGVSKETIQTLLKFSLGTYRKMEDPDGVSIQNIRQLVIGHETVPHNHFHIVIGCYRDIYGVQNNILKRIIKEQFKVEGSEFSVSSVRSTVRKTIMYTIKDCDYVQEGFDEEWIRNVQIQSSKKFKRKEFATEMENNENKYYEGKITESQFRENYLKIKDSYNQKANMNAEMKYLITHMKRKDPTVREQYNRELQYKIDMQLGRITYR